MRYLYLVNNMFVVPKPRLLARTGMQINCESFATIKKIDS